MVFYQEDDLKIKREFFVITEFEMNQDHYVIYTDMVSEKDSDDFRVFVGKIIHNNVIRVSEDIEEAVRNRFREEERNILNQLKEGYNEV